MGWAYAFLIVCVFVLVILFMLGVVGAYLHAKHEREWAESTKADREAADKAWELVHSK